jgi:hypothetical protein
MKHLSVLVCIGVLLMPVAHADWDPVEDARERAAAQAARQARAKAEAERAAYRTEAERKAAVAYRQQMGASANGLSDREVIAQYPRWAQQQSQAKVAAVKPQINEAMARLTPEQRAMIEKQSGQSIDALMRDLDKAGAPPSKAKK